MITMMTENIHIEDERFYLQPLLSSVWDGV